MDGIKKHKFGLKFVALIVVFFVFWTFFFSGLRKGSISEEELVVRLHKREALANMIFSGEMTEYYEMPEGEGGYCMVIALDSFYSKKEIFDSTDVSYNGAQAFGPGLFVKDKKVMSIITAHVPARVKTRFYSVLGDSLIHYNVRSGRKRNFLY